MTQCLRIALVGLVLSGVAWPARGVKAASDCERAKGLYNRAIQETDRKQALSLIDQAVMLCPSFQAWFVKGNAHRTLRQWSQALTAFQHAMDETSKPKYVQMAKAYIALTQHDLGHTCEAVHTFQQLISNPDEGPPAWIREPYEAFELSLAKTPMTATQMACALNVAKGRDIGVCPRLNVRIHFDFDSADIASGDRSQVANLADALRQANSDTQRYRLVGHTDSRGSAAYNQDLSSRRAERVLAEVVRLKPALHGRIDAQGKGESELFSPGDTEREHQLNRRVEVQVLCR